MGVMKAAVSERSGRRKASVVSSRVQVTPESSLLFHDFWGRLWVLQLEGVGGSTNTRLREAVGMGWRFRWGWRWPDVVARGCLMASQGAIENSKRVE